MNIISHLALYGLLAVAQARPDGYNYERPQQTLQLNQNQLSSAYQQVNRLSSHAPQQLQLSQSQQSSSYQQNLPQLSQLSAPSVQYGVPNVQSFQSSQNQYLAPNIQSSQNQYLAPSLQSSQNQYLAPSLQSSQNQYLAPSLQSSQNQYLAPSFQSSQNQYLAPNLQSSQSSLALQSSLQSQGVFPNFGAQNSLNQFSHSHSQQQVLPQISQGSSQYSSESQESLVTKHIYVHVAPDEPEAPAVRVISPAPVAPRKSYKIIFIKAPKSSSSQQQVIHLPSAPQPIEEKTLVYVLVDKPQQPEIVVPTPAPRQPSKPEVYFIKYKAQSGQAINSGESTSSLFSGGLPGSKYGPPGYQKRSTNE